MADRSLRTFNRGFLLAAERGDVETLRQMLDEGTDVDTRAKNGWTALMMAAAFGKTKAFELLLSRGADPELTDNAGNTALHHAASGGKTPILRALIDRGVDVDARTQQGWTPLHCAVFDERIRAVRYLIKAGADVNAQSDDQFPTTPLKTASGHDKIAEILKQAGAKLDPHQEQKIAATIARATSVRQQGREAEFRPEEVAAFVQAASYGDVAAVQGLLDVGMPVGVRDERGTLAIVNAATTGHIEMFELLLQAGATWERGDAILCMASLGACDDIVQQLLGWGVDPDEPDKDQMTPLMWASMQGAVSVVRRLLAAGADPNIRVRNWIYGPKGGKTALELAQDNRQKEVIPLLGEAMGLPPEEFAEDPAFAAARRIWSAAKSPEFREILDLLADACGRRPVPWQKRKGAFRCYLPPSSSHRLEDLQAEIRAAGFQLVVYDISPGFRNSAKLMVFPTDEKYVVLVARGTNGANYGLTTRAVIAWLRNLEKENPFDLTACGFDFVEGRFRGPVVNAETWADRMFEFCPDCGTEILHELRQGAFSFWWD